MKLSEEQQKAVRDWLAAGASLAEVQARLKDEFNLHFTYMDVRLLVLELGATVKDKPEPKKPVPPPEDLAAENEPDTLPPDNEGLPPENEDATNDEGALPPTGNANVTLSTDKIVPPGALISGTLTFTDGVKAKWAIDQMGRFALNPEKEGYRPSDADLQDLQLKLRAELQRKGLM